MIKEIDLGKAGDCFGKFIRVKVEVDVTKPLELGFFIDVKNSEPIMVYVMYARLPNYCFDCGHLSHISQECPFEDSNRDYTLKKDAKYADWLKAPLPFRPRKGHETP